jgi:hypothetical protein
MPSARTATIVMLVMWAVAALWGWFFVEPTVLRDSQAVREYVDFTTKVFPWLDNIRKLGLQAEKGLFLHSVYFFALAPVTISWSLIMASRPEAAKLLAAETLFKTFVCFCFFCLLEFSFVWIMYHYIFQPSFGKLHRTGYSFVVGTFSVPLVAPFFIMAFWHVLSAALHFGYLSVCKLISKK